MALTLNGIAQGYITDRVTQLLRNGGLDRALVDMGEIRGLNQNVAGTPWQVGLANPGHTEQVFETVQIVNWAPFHVQRIRNASGCRRPPYPYLRPENRLEPAALLQCSVMAPTATMADALSTAFSNMDLVDARSLTQSQGIQAWFILPDGSKTALGA